MIYLDNGISVYAGKQYKLDPNRCSRDCINLISHAHMDHVPSSFNAPEIICSDITGDIIESRSQIKVDNRKRSCPEVEVLDSGHVPGSSMFLIKGDNRILYTGDFNTRRKYFTDGARPVKADILIMESTFGRDKYIFPPTHEVISSIRDWVDDNAAKGLHSVIYAYSFGKSQEVINCLSDHIIYAHRSVLEVNSIINKFGYGLSAGKIPDGLKEPSVIVAPSNARNLPELKRIFQSGARSASVSGWAMDEGHRYAMRVNEAFPLSDHADYNGLMKFARGVSPEIIYTVHGFDKEFARNIRETLGIEAQPLKEIGKGHTTLSNFF